MNILLKFFLISLFFLINPFTLSAHGGGPSFPQKVGDYVVEFEYDQPEVIDRVPTAFTFRLLDANAQAGVIFDSVLVIFKKKDDNSSVLTANLNHDDLVDGLSRFTGTLDRGDYVVNVKFKKDDKYAIEAIYDLSVVPGKTSAIPHNSSLLVSFVGMLVGFVLGRVTVKK